MALDTIPKQEGGKLKAVASGTLPSGQPVVVNADGTVSAAANTSVSQVQGSKVTFLSDNARDISSTFDSTNNKVVVCYRDSDNSSYGTAIVGTVDPSDNSISFGTPAVFQSNYLTGKAALAFDASSSKVVISFGDESNLSGGQPIVTSIVATVSGTSISFGTRVAFTGNPTLSQGYISSCFDSTNNKVIVAFSELSSSEYGKAIVGTVSGTSISFGSVTTFEAANTDYIDATFDTTSSRVLISYADDGNSDYGTAVVGEVSGTSISFGTPVVFNAGRVIRNSILHDPVNNKAVIFYRDLANSNYGAAIVGTVDPSNNSISFGTEVVFNNSGTTAFISADYDASVGKFVVAYRDNNNSGSFSVGSVSGTSISFETKVQFSATDASSETVIYDVNSESMVISYADNNATYAGTSFVLKTGGSSTNLTSENYIGMSGGVVNSETVTQALGSVVDITNTSPEYFALAFDEDAGKVVVAYKLASAPQYGYAAVGTVSGMSITFGTPVAYTSSALASRSQGIVFDSSNNKVVISYVRSSDNNGQAIVGTVSGDSISFGSATTFNTGTTTWVSSVFDTSNNKVVISYSDGGNSDYGTAIVGTVSGTSISFGTEVVFESAEATFSGSAFDSVNNKVVLSYRDDGNSGKGTAIVGTVSGTSISFGTAAVFNDASTYWTNATFDSTNGKAVVVYNDDGNSSYGTAVVGTVSGTDISFGSEVVFQTSSSTAPVAAFDSGVGKVTVAYRNSGNSNNTTIVPATVSGTSISFDTAVDVGVVNGGGESIGIVFDSTNNKIVTTFKDDTANDNSAVVFKNGGTITTRGQVASGGAATVDIVGTVSTNQIGLTAGQQYYVQTDGTLSEIPADPSVLAGTAISATKLIVKT